MQIDIKLETYAAAVGALRSAAASTAIPVVQRDKFEAAARDLRRGFNAALREMGADPSTGEVQS